MNVTTKPVRPLVLYRRVSTQEQGDSKLGLDAQQEYVEMFAKYNGFEIVEVFTEVASGKLPIVQRPQLKAAISLANKLKCAIVVSKLDRLSRQASFIMNMMESKAKFIIAELGEDVDTLSLHIHAVISQRERDMISKRTKDALMQLKAKGVKLGGPTQKEASIIGAAAMCSLADDWAIRMGPIVNSMVFSGLSFKDVAEALNNQGMKTRKGSSFTVATITAIRNRLAMGRNK